MERFENAARGEKFTVDGKRQPVSDINIAVNEKHFIYTVN